MRNLNFTKEHTQIAKGVAIVLMLAHHLFPFPERIHVSPGYISMFSINGVNIEYTIGIFGKLCVAMYLFLSGYGIYMVVKKKGGFTFKEAFIRVKNLYINYWIIFIIFIPIGFIFFNRSFNTNEFIKNFIALSSSYNNEWWFFKLYIQIIILFPIFKIIVNNKLYKSLINIILFVVGIRLLEGIINKYGINNFLIDQEMIDMLKWQVVFLIGYICAKFNIYSIVLKTFVKFKIDNKIIYLILSISVIIIRSIKGSILIDSVLAPIFIFSVVNILYSSVFKKIFLLLGKHSTNMWLIHSFFCYTYFQWLVFKPRISILILIWLIILSMLSSIVINFIDKGYKKLILKNGYILFQSLKS